MASPYWAVVQTEVRREHVARMYLMRERYETYAPRIRRQGRIEQLFASYIFVRIIAQWYPARWSIGVTRILMDGQSPAHLADEVVASIRRREVDGIVVLPRAPRLRMGQPVRVVRGSFQDRIGIYDGMIGRDRERILLELLGRKVSVILHGRDVVAADAGPAK
jgi:transcriptional antiterminator RfaH